MTKLPNMIVRLATELIKYYATKTFGEGALGVLAEGLSDVFGESTSEKITT